ncbi:MAG: hypothetical protein K2X72_08420 [Reyranella sp.]|nr:hypothetical protein [Reyranella sp.]
MEAVRAVRREEGKGARLTALQANQFFGGVWSAKKQLSTKVIDMKHPGHYCRSMGMG